MEVGQTEKLYDYVSGVTIEKVSNTEVKVLSASADHGYSFGETVGKIFPITHFKDMDIAANL